MPAAGFKTAAAATPAAKPVILGGNKPIIKGLAIKPGGIVKRKKSGAASWPTADLLLSADMLRSVNLLRLIADPSRPCLPVAAGKSAANVPQLTPRSLAALLKQMTQRSQHTFGKWMRGRSRLARTMTAGALWSSSVCAVLCHA